jgi:predicted NBD/HSP70 family sugar kinase
VESRPGVGSQYFSQQALGRLVPASGIEADLRFAAEKLKRVQRLMAEGDVRARQNLRTIGVYPGYGLAHFASFYDVEQVLVLGG